MNRYKRWRDKKFTDWKQRVKNRLPEIVISFYTYNGFLDYSHHKNLGFVIKSMSDPYYHFMSEKWEHISEEEVLSRQIILEIQVEQLFNLVSKLKNKENG